MAASGGPAPPATTLPVDMDLAALERRLCALAGAHGLTAVSPDATVALAAAMVTIAEGLAQTAGRRASWAAEREREESQSGDAKRRRLLDGGYASSASAVVPTALAGPGPVIRAVDAAAAVRSVKERAMSLPLNVRAAKWFVVPIAPNNSCLFLSLAVSWQLLQEMRRATDFLRFVQTGQASAPPDFPFLNGYATAMTHRAQAIRADIVRWYDAGLERPLPGGELTRAHDDPANKLVARPMVRGDLIALFHTADKDVVPETLAADVVAAETRLAAAALAGTDVAAAEREVAEARAAHACRTSKLKAYLADMSDDGTWGTEVEWIAWAYRTGVAHAAYRPRPGNADEVDGRTVRIPPLTTHAPALEAPVPADVRAMHEAGHGHEQGQGQGQGQGAGGAGDDDKEEGESEEEDEDEDEEDEDDDGLFAPPPHAHESASDEGSGDDDDELAAAALDKPVPPPRGQDVAFAARLLFRADMAHYAVLVTAAEFWTLFAVHGEALLASNQLVPLGRYIRHHML